MTETTQSFIFLNEIYAAQKIQLITKLPPHRHRIQKQFDLNMTDLISKFYVIILLKFGHWAM